VTIDIRVIKIKKSLFIIFLIGFLFLVNITLVSKEYIVSVYDIPTSKYFVELFKAIDEITTDTFNIQIVPPGRGVYLMES
jgi:hypothetical protein